jgi:Arc/MetJ-type ribon-helix-helix transcriptional regulator
LGQHWSLRSLVAEGIFSDSSHFLRFGAKNEMNP